MASADQSTMRQIETAVAALDDGLGSATKVHLARRLDGACIAVGRWRHDGAEMALGAVTPVRLVFSLAGGQRLRWDREVGSTTSIARCGSVAIVSHDPTTRIDVAGRGDTMQVLVAGAADAVKLAIALSRPARSAKLRSLSAQALVALQAAHHERLNWLLDAMAPLIEAPVIAAPGRMRGGLPPTIVARIKADVHAQLLADPERLPSVRELADRAGLSLWHFIRAFAASEGQTPHAWVADQRREHAVSLLLQEGRSVTDAAIASGYGSAAHFVATFRRVLGVTPGRLQAAVLDARVEHRNFAIPPPSMSVLAGSRRSVVMEVARWMIAIIAVYNYGGILFDAVLPKTAAMHQGNPAWPPHAKFHNAQTMMLGLLLGSLALVILFAVHPLTFPLFLIAAAVAGAYFFAMVLAQFFPRVLWVDPEFEGVVPRRFGLNPQQFVTYVLCAFWTVAVALAVVRA